MEAQERIEEDSMPQKVTDGRDELNLAEFPLCALAHRLRPDQKTLQFEDHLWDERRGQTITRQLTITGSDAYGLPTALDEEVLLGLIQLSKSNQFADRTVRFTRYQLIQMLGWRNESKSYERVEASLNRWTGVTLYYQRAWWNKAKQCWVDEKFHVLDNVRLFHRENACIAVDDEAATSTFVWNEVIFRSFQAGNLKSIDFDFFRALGNAIAKRLYRFLDKRFFRRSRWEFDLKEFAWEHAGLSRNYDAANLKRKLRLGIAELEQYGYLRTIPEKERFRKMRGGEWRVVFEKGEPVQSNSPNDEPSEGLIAALMERGVSPSTARTTVRQFTGERIQAQLEVFDYLVAQKDAKVSRNPPGFLLSAIRGEYAPPKDFLDHAAQERHQREAEQRRARESRHREQQQAAVRAKEEAREMAIRRFWQTLSATERERAEQDALNQTSPVQRKMLEQGGTLAAATRKAVLNAFALRLIGEGS